MDTEGNPIEVPEGSRNWLFYQKSTRQPQFFIKDDRNSLVSRMTDLSNWDWYGYYLLDCCSMHDYAMSCINSDSDYNTNSIVFVNESLNKLCDYGYLPAIMLPTQLQPRYESVLLARINELGLPYVQVHSSSFFQHTRLSMKDTWVHKMDVAKLLGLPNPENIDVTVVYKLLCVKGG